MSLLPRILITRILLYLFVVLYCVHVLCHVASFLSLLLSGRGSPSNFLLEYTRLSLFYTLNITWTVPLLSSLSCHLSLCRHDFTHSNRIILILLFIRNHQLQPACHYVIILKIKCSFFFLT